jgi:mono/diheme cytochrome c family protein
MSSWRDACAAAALFGLCLIAQAADERFPGIGRAATPKELAAWDIDVRPDFKGLPPGRGSVADGMAVLDGKCASCHGVFGESNQVFNPLVGGTTADDVRTGRVKALTDGSYPGRTSMMKLSTLSSLWDYIRRAMPWNEPKSLTNDEVYAVTAYMLHLAEVVPQDFVLSDRNVADVQQRLPNRDGMTTAHALWPGRSMGGTRAMRTATSRSRTAWSVRSAARRRRRPRRAPPWRARTSRASTPAPRAMPWTASSSARAFATSAPGTPGATMRWRTCNRRSGAAAAAPGAPCRCRRRRCPMPMRN